MFDNESETFSHWRLFNEDDLYPQGFGWGANINTLMTIQQTESGIHVCFMLDRKHPGLSAVNGIAELASAVYREALENQAAQKGRTPINLLDDFIHSPNGHRPLLPGDFHFYVYIPPAESGLTRESFSKVELTFDRSGFHSPEWHELDVIPRLIQNARFEHMKQAAAVRPAVYAPGHFLEKIA